MTNTERIVMLVEGDPANYETLLPQGRDTGRELEAATRRTAPVPCLTPEYIHGLLRIPAYIHGLFLTPAYIHGLLRIPAYIHGLFLVPPYIHGLFLTPAYIHGLLRIPAYIHGLRVPVYIHGLVPGPLRTPEPWPVGQGPGRATCAARAIPAAGG